MKKFSTSVKWLVMLGCLLLLALVVFFSLTASNENVRTITVKRANVVQKVTVAGMIVPLRQNGIASSYAGYIQKIFVKMGQKVKKGDPIVSITESSQSNETVYPIRAPYDGIVTLIRQAEGEATQGGSDNFIVRVDDWSKFFLEAEVPEINMPSIKAGQLASVRVLPILNQIYNGIVQAVALAPPRQAGSDSEYAAYPARIEILNPDDKLRPGMSAVADITVAEKKGILLLPREFVNRNGDDFYYVILKNGKKRAVTLGMQSTEGIEIKGGLKEGEVVKQVNYLARS